MVVARQRALNKHSVISCAIAKGWALRERGNVRTSGGSIIQKIEPCCNALQHRKHTKVYL